LFDRSIEEANAQVSGGHSRGVIEKPVAVGRRPDLARAQTVTMIHPSLRPVSIFCKVEDVQKRIPLAV
jgi:hypothetical protein